VPFIALLFAFSLIFLPASEELQTTKPYQKNDKLTMVPFLRDINRDTSARSPMIRLHKDGGDFFCTAVVIDLYRALTAAHCVQDSFGNLTEETIKVYDSNVNFVSDATAEVMNLYSDSAIIRGDFSTVQSSWPDFTGEVMLRPGDKVYACGYPQGQLQQYCIEMTLIGNSEFKLAATGVPLVKGMSGGPVMFNGRVIGVNSAVSDIFNVLGPIVGLHTFLEIPNE
jgi:hypothetical protein